MSLVLTIVLLAAQHAAAPSSAAASPPCAAPASRIAAALVFPPIISASLPPIDLTRDERQPVAIVGFDQPTVTYYHLRLDDRQYGDFYGPFGRSEGVYRRAVTVRIGVSTR